MEYWHINRASLSNVYKAFEESNKHHNIKGFDTIEETIVSDANFDDLDEDSLYDLLDDINGVEDSSNRVASLEYNEQVLFDSLVYISTKADIGCRPYFKTIYSFVSGNINTPFYDTFKLNDLFGCLPNVTNQELQELLDRLVTKQLVSRLEMNFKYLYYPKVRNE